MNDAMHATLQAQPTSGDSEKLTPAVANSPESQNLKFEPEDWTSFLMAERLQPPVANPSYPSSSG
jgi:hypothetical protein